MVVVGGDSMMFAFANSKSAFCMYKMNSCKQADVVKEDGGK